MQDSTIQLHQQFLETWVEFCFALASLLPHQLQSTDKELPDAVRNLLHSEGEPANIHLTL